MSFSFAKQLSKTLGGKWTYHYSTWRCDDGVRSVWRCSAGVDEFDNPVGPPQYWLYGDGVPRRAEQYIFKPVKVSKTLMEVFFGEQEQQG
jgi:hypothetical protein